MFSFFGEDKGRKLPEGGSGWVRTNDLAIMSRSLSPLSYGAPDACYCKGRSSLGQGRSGQKLLLRR